MPSRGTPLIAVRLNAEFQAQLEAYRETHQLPDTSAAIRHMIIQGIAREEVGQLSTSEFLNAWEKLMEPHRSQKWYASARAALGDLLTTD